MPSGWWVSVCALLTNLFESVRIPPVLHTISTLALGCIRGCEKPRGHDTILGSTRSLFNINYLCNVLATQSARLPLGRTVSLLLIRGSILKRWFILESPNESELTFKDFYSPTHTFELLPPILFEGFS